MPGFKDALKAYKTNTNATPAVNPPEAPAIMEKQTEPETEGKPEPAPLEVGKKTRAPRGSSKKSAEPAASTDSAQETEAPKSDIDPETAVRALLNQPGPEGSGHAFAVPVTALVEALFKRGYGVTKL